MSEEPEEEASKPCTLARQIVEVVLGMAFALAIGVFVLGLSRTSSTIFAFFGFFLLTGIGITVARFVLGHIWPCEEKRKSDKAQIGQAR